MKKILKIVSGFVAVAALSCLLAAPAQARTFVSVNVGFPGFGFSYGGYGGAPRYAAPPVPVCAPVYVAAPVCSPAPVVVAAPCYPVAYGYRAPVYYRPACAYYRPGPVGYYGHGGYCR